jgi:hypothetical protein
VIASDLEREAEIAEDVALEIDGEHGLAEVGVERQEAITETLLMVRGSGGHGYDRDTETVKLETLYGEEGELS